ncbi:MAG: hypothetical protein ACYDD1_03235 [Caulobacteraceae bacterium]
MAVYRSISEVNGMSLGHDMVREAGALLSTAIAELMEDAHC